MSGLAGLQVATLVPGADAAVLDYTARFDGVQGQTLKALELTQAELKAAFDGLPAAQRSALQLAAQRVRSYHEAQKRASGESWSYRDADGTLHTRDDIGIPIGLRIWQRVPPADDPRR